MINRLITILTFSLFLYACKAEDTYTLYRSSPLDDNMRIHVATFDSSDGNDYNLENCNIAKSLFANQSGVAASFWCEKGHYRK